MSSISSLSNALTNLLGGGSSTASTSPSTSSSTAANSVAGQPALQLNGLISGINTDQVITGLLAIDQERITDITNKEAQVQAEQAAFQQIQTKLLTLQNDITSLGQTQNGVFDGRTVTPSDSTIVTGAASSSAAPGVYNLQVNALAQAQQIASQGFSSATATIGTGTFQIQSGSGTATTITVDSSNDTLQGLANAINNAGVGVSAAVINDGSGTGNQPFRLLLTAQQTGTANAITISNNLTGGASNDPVPEFNQSSIGPANVSAGFTGTSVPTSNTGAGGYTGTSNDAYTFTVLNSGTVGTDNNIQVGYTDASGAQTGTLTINASDVGVAKSVANGIQVQFGAGTLVAGQQFTIKGAVPTVQPAVDASVSLGTGDGALTVTSSTNQLNNLIPGVTLQLQGAAARQVSVTVGSDTSTAQKAIDSFVSDYNDLVSYIDQQTQYNATSGQGGTLLGDSRATQIENQLQLLVSNVIPNVNPQANRLSAIGITTNDQGQLVVDDTKLSSALSGGVSGVTLNDVRNLFTMSGTSSNAGITFVTGSAQTKGSGDNPYTVQVAQAATQASITATNALTGPVTIDSTNDSLTLSLDGATGTVNLVDGTYTPAQLADMVQSATNSSTSFVGRQVSVALQNNQLAITSSTYGSASQVAVGGGDANTALGLAGTEASKGTDVIGSFVVNGVTETATGNGQYLVGDATNPNTAGLQVRVNLSAAQVGSGTSATLTVNQGYASQFSSVLENLVDPVTGQLKSIDDSFNQELTELQADDTTQTQLMAAKKTQLQDQFTQMESTLASLQSISSQLSGFASGLSSITPSSSSSSSSSQSSA